ncbi:hypothetical protein [Bradyrhizobium ivorense]|uniref:hypothetical protein n=1 Tax=Bradyrhizobium ivorense TaxID=2511166 RepID=UPI0027E21D07|nr:hypothetical protein [Bradyrhizobium ivorense]
MWSPVAAEATASGYDVAWKDSWSGQYAVWTTDDDGNLNNLARIRPSLESIEPIFHEDLNGDGVIGVPPVSSAIEASGGTSLDRLGNHYLLDTIGVGLLTVADAQSHASHLSLVDDHTQTTFNLARDSSGGTLVIDPSKDQFDFGSVPAPQRMPAAQPETAAGLAGESFAFDRAGSSAGAADFSLRADHPAMPQPDSIRSALPATDHPELFHVAAPVDAHLAQFHNFMLHQ